MASPGTIWSVASQKPTKTGAEIREKIEANRQKRLAIAEAMKAEAGVKRHDLNGENEGGLAYLRTGVILSPQGRNMMQLFTVAHECGHIFLHSDAPGLGLPSHVKEMEAEMYAHQVFREHGMVIPPDRTVFGRDYVNLCIDKDKAARVAISAHALAYAMGSRSPYEPLRKVPATWQLHHSMPEVRFPPQVQYNYTKIWRLAQRLADVPRSWTDKLKRDARAWMSFVGSQALYAAFVFDIGCSLLGYVPLVPEVEVVRHSVHTSEFAWLTIGAGLSYTFLASVMRTMWR